jgi:hypothetical protein
MNPRLAHWLIRLYPREWRERYGEEFEALLQTGRGDLRTLSNVVWSALCERVFPTSKLRPVMNPYPGSIVALVKLPSAFVPIAMSLTALAVVLGSIALFGVVRDADEGAVAHIWQLLMAGQIPILAFFVVKWLPRTPRQTLGVAVLQIGAWLASAAPIFFLGL